MQVLVDGETRTRTAGRAPPRRRVERELTLSELGDKTGFSAQYISGAELARTTVPPRGPDASHKLAHIQALPGKVLQRNAESLRDQERGRIRIVAARDGALVCRPGPTDRFAPAPRQASAPRQ